MKKKIKNKNMKSEIKDITPTKKNIEIEVSAEEFDVFAKRP